MPSLIVALLAACGSQEVATDGHIKAERGILAVQECFNWRGVTGSGALA